MSRPKWCTAQRWAVNQAIALGLNRDQAAAIGGVTKRTLQRWLAAGRSDLDAGKEGTDDARFASLIEQTEAQYEQDQLRTIRAASEAGPHNWTAAAWLLERKWPERYGKRDVVKLEGGDTPLIQLNIGDPKTREVNQRVLEALALLPAPEVIEGELAEETG